MSKKFGDKTPAQCGERDVLYGRRLIPHKEVDYVRLFNLTEEEVAEYKIAYRAAMDAGLFAEAIN